MKKIIYSNLNGGISVVYPVISNSEEISEAQAEQRAWDQLPIDAINPRWIDESEIPIDRTFRNAWKDNGVIEVDMPKAKEIHKEKLRELRKPLLEKLDVEFMQAIESGLDTKVIAKKKKDLRDITIHPEIDSAKTPEELKVAALSVLK